MENWKSMLDEALKENGETWPMKKSVYFPLCYDGSEWVGRVTRNPDGKATDHQSDGQRICYSGIHFQ